MYFKIIVIAPMLLAIAACKKKDYTGSQFIGHAGGGLSIENSAYHDNSAEAVRYAIEMQGIDGVEVDLQCSEDGTAWLFHDPTINLESNGSGCINSLPDEYLEGLHYATLLKEKLLKLKDLDFPFGSKKLYLDIRTFNYCKNAEINQQVVIDAISEALSDVSPGDINVIVVNNKWVEPFYNKGWNVFFEAEDMNAYLNDEVILSQTVGLCIRNGLVERADIEAAHEKGKQVMLFDFRSPKSIRQALKKKADLLSVDDLKGALIEKY